jgi:hypothetical protein
VSHIIPITLAGAAIALGLLLYACSKKKCWPSIWLILEAPAWGAAIGSGLNLMIAAFNPNLLAHVKDANGRVLEPPAITVEVEQLERVHIFIGGAATVVVGAWRLRIGCLAPCSDERGPH